MEETDLQNPHVQWHEPSTPYHITEGIVATRDGEIVGAAWYTDSVNASQPWHLAVGPRLPTPARFAVNFFVVPGDKAAAWALGRTATDALATEGVRAIVGIIGARNSRSILMTRLLGSKMVARIRIRRCCGRVRTVVESVDEDRKTGITAMPA